jgi:hypothetical protein
MVVLRVGHDVLLVDFAARIDGLRQDVAAAMAIWTARRSVDVQRAQAPFELHAVYGVGGERDRALVRSGGARGVARNG